MSLLMDALKKRNRLSRRTPPTRRHLHSRQPVRKPRKRPMRKQAT